MKIRSIPMNGKNIDEQHFCMKVEGMVKKSYIQSHGKHRYSII